MSKVLWQLVKVTSCSSGLLNSNETEELMAREPAAEPPHETDVVVDDVADDVVVSAAPVHGDEGFALGMAAQIN